MYRFIASFLPDLITNAVVGFGRDVSQYCQTRSWSISRFQV